jgi:hypothetical protein
MFHRSGDKKGERKKCIVHRLKVIELIEGRYLRVKINVL